MATTGGFRLMRGHGLRIYHGGVMKYGAKAMVICELLSSVGGGM